MKRMFNWGALGIISAIAAAVGFASPVRPELAAFWLATVPAFMLARQGRNATPYAVAFALLSLVHTGMALYAMTALQALRFVLAAALMTPVAAALGMTGYLLKGSEELVTRKSEAQPEATPEGANVPDTSFGLVLDLEPKRHYE